MSSGFGNLSSAGDFTGSIVEDSTNGQITGNYYSSGVSNWDMFQAVGLETGLFDSNNLSYTGFSGLSSGYSSSIRSATASSIFDPFYGINSSLRLSFRAVRAGKPKEINYVKFSIDPLEFSIGDTVADVVFMNGQYKDTQPLVVVSTGTALATAAPRFV